MRMYMVMPQYRKTTGGVAKAFITAFARHLKIAIGLFSAAKTPDMGVHTALGISRELLDASTRSGIRVMNVPIVNGVAKSRFDFTRSFNLADIKLIKKHFKSLGANKLEIDSGVIVSKNLKFLPALRKRARKGKMFGGKFNATNAQKTEFRLQLDLK